MGAWCSNCQAVLYCEKGVRSRVTTPTAHSVTLVQIASHSLGRNDPWCIRRLFVREKGQFLIYRIRPRLRYHDLEIKRRNAGAAKNKILIEEHHVFHPV